MPQWFYAHGDQQLGPVSDAEIKRLVGDGSIRPQDEVWCEGMPDWKPAGEVRTVSRTPAHAAATASPRRMRKPARRASFGRHVGGTRKSRRLNLGADRLSRRDRREGLRQHRCSPSRRAEARSTQATADFNYDYESKKLRLETQREEINEKTTLTEYDNERLNDIDKDLADLEEDNQTERRRLTRTTWRNLQYSADTAQANQQMWSYWHAIGFVLGSIVLTVGLIISSITGDVAQRLAVPVDVGDYCVQFVHRRL